MLNEKAQNPRGIHVFENSKFAILDPQRVRMNICHLFILVNMQNRWNNLRIYLQIEISKTQFYIYNHQWWNLACENMLYKPMKNQYLWHFHQNMCFSNMLKPIKFPELHRKTQNGEKLKCAYFWHQGDVTEFCRK